MNSPNETNKSPVPQRLLCLGFGDLAARLTAALPPQEWAISGLSRSQKSSTVAGLTQGNAADPAALRALLQQDVNQVLVTLTPDARTEQAYRMAYLDPVRQLVLACRKLGIAPHLLFVSSTAVYAQNRGEWVDEASSAEPLQFNGRILRQAEQLLEYSELPYTLLRFSGIYGRNATIPPQMPSQRSGFSPGHWTNRIHVDDCVGSLAFVLDRYARAQQSSGLLVASDRRPVTQGAIENWLRAAQGLPRQTWHKLKGSGKRCCSGQLQRLGYRFQLEDFRQAYGRG